MALNDIFNCFDGHFAYSKDYQNVTLREFQAFLLKEQNEPVARDDKVVSSIIRDFVQDSQREVQEPNFATAEVRRKRTLYPIHQHSNVAFSL